MKAPGRHDMGLKAVQQQIWRGTDRPKDIRHGRQRNRYTLQSVALSVAVQRLVLELLEHDLGRLAGPGPSACDGISGAGA